MSALADAGGGGEASKLDVVASRLLGAGASLVVDALDGRHAAMPKPTRSTEADIFMSRGYAAV